MGKHKNQNKNKLSIKNRVQPAKKQIDRISNGIDSDTVDTVNKDHIPTESQIQSVKEYIERVSIYINSVTVDGYKPYLLFRGQENEEWNIDSGFYRIKKTEFESMSESQINRIMVDYHEKYLNEIYKRKTTHLPLKNMSKLSIIAESQHLGGKTAIIDFTENSLVALYFACKQTNTLKIDAKVVILNTETGFTDFKTISGKETEDKGIDHFLFSDKHSTVKITDKTIYLWTPPIENTRILKQDSVFVLTSIGKLDADFINASIGIDKDKKELILNELDIFYNISERTLFPDFFGYIKDNSLYKSSVLENKKAYYREALRLYKKGSLKDAEEQISAAVSLIENNSLSNDFDPQIYNLYGTILYAAKRIAEAIEKYEIAIEKNNQDPWIYSNIADCYSILMNMDKAIEYYKKAEDIIVTNKQAFRENQLLTIWRNIAGLCIFIHNFETAYEYYSKIVDEDKSDIIAKLEQLSLSVLLYPDNDISDDLDVIEKKIPNNADAYNVLGSVFLLKKDDVKALFYIEKAISLNNANFGYWINKGVIHNFKNEKNYALNCFDRALDINPHVFITFIHLAEQYFSLNMPQKAEEVYLKALKNFPNNPYFLLRLGHSLKQQRKFKEAITAFDEALTYSDLNPQLQENIYFSKAWLYVEQKNITNANLSLDKIKKENLSPEAMGEINRLKEQIQSITDESNNNGLPSNKSSLEPMSDKELDLFKKALDEESKGRYIDAYHFYNEIIVINQSLPTVYYNRGCMFFTCNLLPQAVADYDKAIELKNDYLDAHYNRAVTFSSFIINDKKLSYKEKKDFLQESMGMIVQTRKIAEKKHNDEVIVKLKKLLVIVSEEIDRLNLLEKFSK